jgi:hypothetical protein
MNSAPLVDVYPLLTPALSGLPFGSTSTTVTVMLPFRLLLCAESPLAGEGSPGLDVGFEDLPAVDDDRFRRRSSVPGYSARCHGWVAVLADLRASVRSDSVMVRARRRCVAPSGLRSNARPDRRTNIAPGSPCGIVIVSAVCSGSRSTAASDPAPPTRNRSSTSARARRPVMSARWHTRQAPRPASLPRAQRRVATSTIVPSSNTSPLAAARCFTASSFPVGQVVHYRLLLRYCSIWSLARDHS